MAHDYYSLNLRSFINKLLFVCFFIITRSFIINASVPLKTDRWLEIDLYWFEHKDMEKSVNEFWDRFYPLLEDVDGWKGVILNVGWISDYILEWHGDMNEMIRLPKIHCPILSQYFNPLQKMS